MQEKINGLVGRHVHLIQRDGEYNLPIGYGMLKMSGVPCRDYSVCSKCERYYTHWYFSLANIENISFNCIYLKAGE